MITLVVETGAGLANANSYGSLESADAYWSLRSESRWADEKATVTLALSEQPTDGETFTIDGKEYTLEAALTESDGHIHIGASVTETQRNIVRAINRGDGAGTRYAAATTEHPSVSAAEFADNECVLTAKEGGEAGNLLAVSETFDSVVNRFSATTMSGGVDTKKQALVEGTQALDLLYHSRWKGLRKKESQALDFPRTGLTDRDGFYISESSIPLRLQEACFEMALRNIISEDGLIPDNAEHGIAAESVRVGPISESIKYIGSKPSGTLFKKVDRLLADLVEENTRMERG